jgi:hypothetical protein
VDAVFYPVALNAIPMKKKQKPTKKSRPATKPRVQNERLKGWKEIASFLGSAGCCLATMGEIRHARDARRQVHVRLS